MEPFKIDDNIKNFKNKIPIINSFKYKGNLPKIHLYPINVYDAAKEAKQFLSDITILDTYIPFASIKTTNIVIDCRLILVSQERFKELWKYRYQFNHIAFSNVDCLSLNTDDMDLYDKILILFGE